VYATQISHLLRFLAKNQIGILDLTDSYFSLFIKALRGERKPSGARCRNNTTVVAIGRVCLDFIDWLACQHGRIGFVGADGGIKAERKQHSVEYFRNSVGRSIVVRYWDHAAFGELEAFEQREPISTVALSKLRGAIVRAPTSPYVRRRRQVMLKLLEITGGRRTEVAQITVEAVAEASLMTKPALRLQTLKKRRSGTSERLVPISKHDLQYLADYVRFNRAPLVKRHKVHAKDKGPLLLSETTGQGIYPNTVTQEIRSLRRLAGISDRACAHMFRHRFFSKIILALLEQHKIENPDAFRQALIDQEALKSKLLELSGHSSVHSLDRYIHLAFEEYTRFSVSYDVVKARMAILSFLGTIEEIGLELEAGGSSERCYTRLKSIMTAIAAELREVKLSKDD
jgi:integrase